jgi:polyphenol oxidase
MAISPGGDRRMFLKTAGLAVGGLGLTRLGSGQPPPITTNEPQDCSAVPTPPLRAVSFVPDPSATLRHRKSAWDLQPADIDKLKAAYLALRALPNDDPRTWIRQANVHCWYCGGGQDGVEGEEIHGSYWFFPWHRCYLYFHERILGKLISDPTFALPYWDWDNDAHRTLPPAYVTPNDASNPLYDDFRGVTPDDQLPTSAVGSTVMDHIKTLPGWRQFMGTTPSDVDNHAGQLEAGPHGYVHLWSGKPSMYLPWGAPDMGVLSTAAQDPVFFTHHCNIDRIWDLWQNSSTTHTPPPIASFFTHTWNFYDEEKQWRSIAVQDVLSAANLNYTYDSAPQVAMRTMAMMAMPQKASLGTEPDTKKVELSPAVTAELKARVTGPPPKRYTLHIDGVELPTGQAAYVRVFVNLPDASAKTKVDDPHFVGYFTVVPRHRLTKEAEAHRKTKHLHNYAFDVTNKIGTLLDDKTELAVTLVPVGADDSKPAGLNLTYRRVYLTARK